MPPPPVIATDHTNEVMTRLTPVWRNTYWIKNALELCEGIWQHAGEIPEQYHHFFGLVHNFALQSVLLDICKLFDRSNRRFAKDTIPDLMNYAKNQFTEAYASRLDTRNLVDLGVSDADAQRIVQGLNTRGNYSQARDDLFSNIERLMPTRENNPTLEKLFLVRDKVVAHQERLDCALHERMKHLPSLDDMEKVNDWSSNLCQLIACMLTNETLLPHGVSARMAALKVVAKVLDKKFDPEKGGAAYEEWVAFYKKP